MRFASILGLAGLCLASLPAGLLSFAALAAEPPIAPPQEASVSRKATVTIMSGTPLSGSATVVRDLASLVRNDEGLRIVPMAGQGPAQTLRDVLYLPGVDLGLTHETVLNRFAESGELGPVRERLVYVARLFNEDVHLLARRDIGTIENLQGKSVNIGPEASSSAIIADALFGALGIEVTETHFSAGDAVAKLTAGEIDAALLIGTTPLEPLVEPLAEMAGPADAAAGLKLLAIPFAKELEAELYPASLGDDDYPALIEPGRRIDTVAVGAVLIAKNTTPPSTGKNDEESPAAPAKLQRFVEAFFSNFDALRQAPHHSRWRDVNLAASLDGWKRAPEAQAWIDAAQHTVQLDRSERARFEAFLAEAKQRANSTDESAEKDAEPGGGERTVSDADRERLFRAFKAWDEARRSDDQ